MRSADCRLKNLRDYFNKWSEWIFQFEILELVLTSGVSTIVSDWGGVDGKALGVTWPTYWDTWVLGGYSFRWNSKSDDRSWGEKEDHEPRAHSSLQRARRMLKRSMGKRDRWGGQDGVVGWLGSQEQGFLQEGRSNSLEVMGTRISTLPPGLDDLKLKRKKQNSSG